MVNPAVSIDNLLNLFRDMAGLEKVEFTKTRDGWKETHCYQPDFNGERYPADLFEYEFQKFLKIVPGSKHFKFLKKEDITKVVYFTDKNGHKGRMVYASGKF